MVCYSLSVLDLGFWIILCYIVYLCMCAFVVSSVLCQELARKNVSEMTYFVWSGT